MKLPEFTRGERVALPRRKLELTKSFNVLSKVSVPRPSTSSAGSAKPAVHKQEIIADYWKQVQYKPILIQYINYIFLYDT